MAQGDYNAPAGVSEEPESRPGGIPLYVWVVAAAVLAIPFGKFVQKTLPVWTWSPGSNWPRT